MGSDGPRERRAPPNDVRVTGRRRAGFRRVWWVAPLPILLFGLIVAGCRAEPKQAGASPVPTSAPASSTTAAGAPLPDDVWVTVQRETVRQYAPAIGSLRAQESTRVAAQVSGRVKEVLVDVGDRVAKDQVLLRLDPTLFELEVKQNEGAVEAARGVQASAAVDVAYWERELARQTDIFKRDAGSQKELDDARTAYQRAVASRDEKQGKFAQAEQVLAYARQRLAETTILAPYDGVITQRLVDPGQMASSMPITELLEIRRVSVLYLEFSLPQELLSVVREGTPVEFEIEGAEEQTRRAAVAVVFPTIDEATRSLRCRVVLANDDYRLHSGALARVRVVEREARQVPAVPRKALVQIPDGWQVFVSNDGHPVPRRVQVGLVTDTLVEITTGLAPGERILAAPH